MSELSTTDIPGWVHTSLQGEDIFDATIPSTLRLPDDSTPVVLDEEVAHLFEPSAIELRHVSKHHGRSYELGPNATRNRLGRIAVWRDEVDNPYTSFSLKGNNFSHGTVMESSTAPSGYIPMGLLESDALLRVIRSSRMLREAGISTEWISRVFEPQHLIYKGELVSQQEYKRRLLLDTANEKGIEEMVNISAALEPMTFFITGRSMEINDRLADFSYDTKDTAPARLKHIFRVYNATHVDDEGFKPLYYSNQADRTRFFRRIFPSLLGINLAKLHNMGLVHTFPTLSNVTILGGLIDLDSIKGEPLLMEDIAINRADTHNDLATITDYDHPSLALKDLYRKLSQLGITKDTGDYIWAQAQLVDSYQNTRIAAPLKRDRTVDRLYISGVNQLIDGAASWKSYMELYKRESKRMAADIWDAEVDVFKHVWSPEVLKVLVSHELDNILRDITKGLSGVDERESLTLEDLNDKLSGPVRHTANFDAISAEKIASKIETNIEKYPSFLSLVPDKTIRLRILTSLSTTLAIEAAEGMKKHNESEMKDMLDETIRNVVSEFLENLSEDNWRPYVSHMKSFEYLEKQPAIDFTILDQKATYGYGDVALENVLKQAKQDGLAVTVAPYEINDNDRFYFTYKGFTQRALLTDGKQFQLNPLHVSDLDYDVVGISFDTDALKDTSYIAWICEPQSPDTKQVIVIQHKDSKVAQQMIDELFAET